MKELIPKIQNRNLPEKWDYDESVKKVRGLLIRWIDMTDDLLHELHVAREELSKSPTEAIKTRWDTRDNSPANDKDWSSYCADIGHARRVVNRWLQSYDPIKRKIEENPIEENQIADEIEPIEGGSIYRLGNHTLFCGDNRDSDFIKFCSREKYPFVFADPPYNSTDADFDGGFEWEHDYLSEWGKIVAVTPGISNLQSFFKKTVMPYKWAMSFYIDNGMTRGALGFGNWILVALFSEDSINRQAQDHYQISITSKDKGFTHKGKKPLDVMRYLIEVFTEPGDTIIDPFLGSGSSLIGAEAQGRKLIGCEIDPLYGAKIIKRWEAYSGGNAILER